MSWINGVIEECVSSYRLATELHCRCRFDEFDTSVTYLPSRRLFRLPICVDFGYGLMFSKRSGLGFILAHELAHVVQGDVSWHARSVLLSPIARAVVGIRKLLPFNNLKSVASPEDEYGADAMAAKRFCSEAFGHFLVLSATAVEGYVEWLNDGTVGGQLLDLGSNFAATPTRSARTQASEPVVFSRILRLFKQSDDVFNSCARMAKSNDKPEGIHPSTCQRLNRLGLNWDDVQGNVDLRSDSLIDLDELGTWATKRKL